MRAYLLALLPVLVSVSPAIAQPKSDYSQYKLADNPDLALYEQFKGPWREHILQAREAMKIDDPLKRCLAWPDLPGNRWPAGHAAAHCRNHFAMDGGARPPRPGLAWLETQLQRGDLKAIDSRLDAELERHFLPEPDFHEAIHYFYLLIQANGQSDALTSRWLRAAPEDAYALLARATYYTRMAAKSRGEKLAAETPRSQLTAMSDYVERAIPLYRKAVSINPRLMPAYEGMLFAARMDSLDAVATEAVKGAEAQDPACPSVAMEYMMSLQPRWGGSYQAMQAYASKLKPHVASRPLLAVYLASPNADLVDVLQNKDTKESVYAAYEPGVEAVMSGSLDSVLADMGDIVQAIDQYEKRPMGGTGEGVAYHLQAVRFGTSPLWGNRWLAELFSWRDPTLGLRFADEIVRLAPAEHRNHYLLAVALDRSGQFEAADKHYAYASEDSGYRLQALREAAQMWLMTREIANEKAIARGEPYVVALEREYPKEGRAGYYRIGLEFRRTGQPNVALGKKALAGTDMSDPWQAERANSLREALPAAAVVP